MDEQKIETESEFAKTSTAAKLSGKIHGTTGFLKKKLGQMTDDIELKTAGQNQQLLGKVHHLVGSLREIRETATEKAITSRDDGLKILRKHGGKLLDQAAEFLDDIKKTFL